MPDFSNHEMWRPSEESIRNAHLKKFLHAAQTRSGKSISTFEALHSWSVTAPQAFWSLLWDFTGIVGDKGELIAADYGRMPGTRWFPEAKINYAENLLKPRADSAEAIVFWGEDRVRQKITYSELMHQVSQLQQVMLDYGIAQGDRVAAFMPNIPETVIAMLACASLGAVFTSTSPDFGVQGVLDRFGQIEPKLLIATDGYLFNGNIVSTTEVVAGIVKNMPSLKATLLVEYVGSNQTPLKHLKKVKTWRDERQRFVPKSVTYVRVSFDHPLFIVYTSGTTGIPKCILHSHGGTLIQHLKEHRLHVDVQEGDRVFFFTTCGWIVWNWMVSALASNAAIILYDGSPNFDTGKILLDFAEQERITFFGTSARWIDGIRKKGLKPAQSHNLEKMRTLGSTGSPLTPESFDYVYADFKKDVHLASLCGGTDIIACFVCGVSTDPVYRGEIQAAALGMDVRVFDEQGRVVENKKGELVCLNAFPSMPVGFWNDAGNRRYKAAYFEKFEGVWTQGDLAEKTSHNGFIIYGRSDATLNPSGVRIGTAEIYRQVEQFDEIAESVVVSQEWNGDARMVLFLRLNEGTSLNEVLIERIKTHIRKNCTARHVPAKILDVPDIPRTKTGKIVELAIRDTIHGRPINNMEALANPDALKHFMNRAELAY